LKKQKAVVTAQGIEICGTQNETCHNVCLLAARQTMNTSVFPHATGHSKLFAPLPKIAHCIMKLNNEHHQQAPDGQPTGINRSSIISPGQVLCSNTANTWKDTMHFLGGLKVQLPSTLFSSADFQLCTKPKETQWLWLLG